MSTSPLKKPGRTKLRSMKMWKIMNLKLRVILIFYLGKVARELIKKRN